MPAVCETGQKSPKRRATLCRMPSNRMLSRPDNSRKTTYVLVIWRLEQLWLACARFARGAVEESFLHYRDGFGSGQNDSLVAAARGAVRRLLEAQSYRHAPA